MTRLDFRGTRAMERKLNRLMADANLEAIRMVRAKKRENGKKERKKERDNALRK
jgi:hypothetical protein